MFCHLIFLQQTIQVSRIPFFGTTLVPRTLLQRAPEINSQALMGPNVQCSIIYWFLMAFFVIFQSHQLKKKSFLVWNYMYIASTCAGYRLTRFNGFQCSMFNYGLLKAFLSFSSQVSQKDIILFAWNAKSFFLITLLNAVSKCPRHSVNDH